MSLSNGNKPSVLLVGGGIGGLAAALALARLGIGVDLLEQSAAIGEIGAGLQLGPNAFAALDALGVGEAVRRGSVFTDRLVMMDAVDCSEVGSVPVGEAYRARFGNPYAVSHRADLHGAIHEAVKRQPLIRFHTSAQVEALELGERGVTAVTRDGRRFGADGIVGCDGVKSVVRAKLIGDAPRVSGHVVYRAVVPAADMPEDLRWNAPVVWAGPNCHLVHYPLRQGEQYNLVVTFHSREREQWGVSEGSKDEVMSYFEGVHARPRQLLDRPTSWRRWSTADREPVATWSEGRATLLGDAAHPMMQYLAQGACMALEDAVTLGAAVEACDFDLGAAFRLYAEARVARTARVVLSVREMGRIYHAKGVERLVRNSLWVGRTPERFYDAVEWLYGWNPAHCLDDARVAVAA
ncbi:3-hydroxybenzoate 6-monooxygenase [Variovorax saccharolyticus]|uniref:3-hydroxybenzoate 6-monooxygenase n=1 Tax=Variovorax saccharolyticus TaxID=3053516 RepID=UPI00257554A1|nr:3-hydroxybenzoate 6-monooxygenase [Variovorax sp. J22R187]MDM0019840.1 3-hydroxybenzoate 6-monooxygenase [Variovorax sp. J22R187]